MQHFLRVLFCSLFVCIAIPLSAQVTANFSANVTSGCSPLLVQFTNSSTPGTTSSWNLGNSTTSVLQNPSTTYTAPGIYTVTLTVTNGAGETDTKTITNYITVYPAPTINFTVSDTAGCPPHAVTFTDQTTLNAAGPGTYQWGFGDGTFSTVQNPAKTFSLPGYYNITLQATNAQGCTKTLTKSQYIHVYDPPVANFSSPNPTPCDAPATVSFTPSITGTGPYSYEWNFGNSTTSTAANPATTYTATGSYTVRLIVTDAKGCKDTIEKINYIKIGSLTAGFTGTTAVCEGSQASFTNTTQSGITGLLWNFGDGGTASNPNATHIYNAPGTYTVTLVVYNGSCTDTVTQSIVVHPKPDINFSFSPNPPCPAPVTLQFTNNTVNGNTYTWVFGDNTTSTAVNPSHTYTGNGAMNHTLIAVSAFGCRDTLIKIGDAIIYPLELEATADPEGGCAPLTVHFTDTAWTSYPAVGAYPFPIISHQWDFGDGTGATGNDVTHTYTSVGIYNAVITVTTSNGCIVRDTIPIHVGIPPTASFTAIPLTICSSEEVYFNNTSTGGNYYTWEFGDGSMGSSSGSTTHQYSTPGTFTVTLHAYHNGCEDTAVRTAYITVNPPNAFFEESYDCDTPTLVRFTGLSIGATSQIWYFGDGTTSTAVSPQHVYPGAGPYNCTLVTFNSTSGCSDTNTHVVQPLIFQPDFYALDTTICLGDTAKFQAVFPPGAANGIAWSLVPPTIYPDTTPYIVQPYAQAGRYTISLHINDFHNCPHSVTKTNYLLVAKPNVAFTGTPPIGCAPLNVTFTDQSTNVTGVSTVNRTWTMGNAGTVSNNNPTTSYTFGVGNYDIKLVVTDVIGCKDSLLKPVYIEARKPHAAFAANDTSACIGQGIIFSNNSTSSTPVNSEWSFGDNTSSTQGQPTHAYTQPGTYTVRLIVTDASGCKDTMVRTSYISVTKPDAAFTMSDTQAICPPLIVNFTNASTAATSYQWAFGDNNGSVVPSPTNSYTTSGQFTVQLVATDVQGCKDTAYGQVKVLGYAGALSYSPLAGCAPLAVNFTANLTNVPTIIWDFSDGYTAPVSGSNTTTHHYETPGAYVPKLIISDGQGCLNSSLGLDTIKVDGVIASFTTGPVCISTPTAFQDNSTLFFSPASSWQWTFANGQTSNGPQPTYTYNSTGTFPVTLVVTNANGCKDTVTQNVTVNPLPVVTASADTVICLGDQAQLSAGGGVSYSWSPAASLNNAGSATPIANPQATTTYTVVGTDAKGCKNADQVIVGLQTKTTSDVGPDTAVCWGSSVQLFASGAHQYQWSPAATVDDPAAASPFVNPTETTTYTVVAKEGSCQPDTNKVRVAVHPKPNVNAGADQTVVAGGSVMLNATGTNTNYYAWSPTETLSCETCSNPTATPLSTTAYVVIASNVYKCTDSDTVVVRIICDQSQVFVPNTFTPNGDGQNDRFYPHGNGIDRVKSFRVYNRWGQLVFEKANFQVNDRSAGWDGMFNGQQAGADVYVYVMEAVCENGEPINWKGDVALIR